MINYRFSPKMICSMCLSHWQSSWTCLSRSRFISPAQQMIYSMCLPHCHFSRTCLNGRDWFLPHNGLVNFWQYHLPHYIRKTLGNESIYCPCADYHSYGEAYVLSISTKRLPPTCFSLPLKLWHTQGNRTTCIYWHCQIMQPITIRSFWSSTCSVSTIEVEHFFKSYTWVKLLHS